MALLFFQIKMFLFITFVASIFLSRLIVCQNVLCGETEKQALLRLKEDLIDPANRLSSWDVERDCCDWLGVVCNNETGFVKELSLANLLSRYRAGIRGKINPSLLNLNHLTSLDLSYNDFSGSPIPSFFGSLVTLRYLNLDFAGFEGLIPYQLGNLSSLHYLSLNSLIRSDSYVENLRWLTSLSSLQYLDMSGVNLVLASDHWFLSINTLSSLITLRLAFCGIFQTPPPVPFVNLTSLVNFDISWNNFCSLSSSLIKWLYSLDKLVSIDLSSTGLGDQSSLVLCSLRNMTLLKTVALSYNFFDSSIPTCLYGFSNLRRVSLHRSELRGVISSDINNLTSIVSLDLGFNSIQGKVPQSMRSLCALRMVDLSNNKLVGNISEVFSTLFGCNPNTLVSLNLAGNLFSGQITDQIGEFENLRSLSIRNNMLSGTIPESIGSLLNLEVLDIYNTNLKGVVSELHLTTLKNLRELSASRNSMTLRVDPDWTPPFQLETIEFSSWNLGPHFPMWLKSQNNFQSLDLSSTGIWDTVPSWFWDLSTSFLYLNLSHNQLKGKIPRINVFYTFSMVYLGSNMFDGPLPQISSSVTELDLSNNSFSGDISDFLCNPTSQENELKILHLGENHLSGKISDCWMFWPKLVAIQLVSDNLVGEIPSSMGLLAKLESLHLRNNNLSGEIPESLRYCTMLKVMDLGLNKFEGRIPAWIGTSLTQLVILGLRANNLKGEIPIELCRLGYLRILDAADNNLSGMIPRCFNNFTAMTTRPNSTRPIFYSFYMGEFMENAFVVTRGREDEYNTILHLLTSLDLSCNKFSGVFPEQLTVLHGLFSLNLSRNHLTGTIPSTISELTWAQSLDLSRNELAGQIPSSVSNLNFLTIFNVSYNNLSGEIPLSTQVQRMEPSNFLGNQFLCGPPLTKACKAPEKATPNANHNKEEQEKEYRLWFRMGLGTGFGVGFLGVIIPSQIYPPWRRFYFWVIERMGYMILDFFVFRIFKYNYVTYVINSML